jgi:indolepyruvate ferredoxin oxidoreductase
VAVNKSAFEWGRRAALDPESVIKLVAPATVATDARRLSATLDEKIRRRIAFLTGYQDAAYAERYRGLIERVRTAEQEKTPSHDELAAAAAEYLFKLMAYKDEYEVARLFTDGSFARQIAATFEGDLRYEFHLAPPLFAKIDPESGRPRKISFGPWMMTAFRWLAKFKFLRGTRLDPFGRSAERVLERRLVEDYVATLEELVRSLTPQNHALAVAIAAMPEKIRGFGPVKQRHVAAAKAEEEALLSKLRAGPTVKAVPAAAE